LGKEDVWLEEIKDGRRETTACKEATKAYPEEMKPATVHQEDPKDDRNSEGAEW
jgi:hypothetical protein